MTDYDNSLHEKPTDFLAGIANTGGACDGQMVLPDNGRYRASCTCGGWSVEVDDPIEGLRLARIHTGSSPT
ncbi:hypothetical protein C731_4838 [Mycolicibacterium hassiacum DSM 44199]|jgi:hypothetical protein|uniref:Uncharacterized protein n=1 Tax=Mycolicibacterium hassiacum (strain DSM 44199 / CIP 105218 / JCM 12690 / 3849) TaxID=1122247 RepID=K5B9V2_MYCHD|nr:hypothetical protein [Mycolicibacterium hassiacum]EKF21135.1 hypothetical protein C731_4838 [Mycolicibacterium hassiacum DSM 44199]MBX5486922.1 hypothetical protein [Mycolicibacterium hassiacum]MDA4086359.1 hypothetical protein [Mycolicibacterium hassiacum DSM 44199]PZN25117.1 MAG: hypothetical protein DIU75_01255 [Mycolicibacterium hassiacum]VCT91334.1 hypothetical protein MHAS_03048 [Mycolicibacterium hassiacum DSM 44199]